MTTETAGADATIMIGPNWHRWSIECECGWSYHRLCIDYGKGDSDFSVSLVVSGNGFWKRLCAAWHVLRGDYEYQDIIVSEAGLAQLEAAVANVRRMMQERAND